MSKRQRLLGILAQAGLAGTDLERERIRAQRDAANAAQWANLAPLLVGATGQVIGGVQRQTADTAAAQAQQAIAGAASSRGGAGTTMGTASPTKGPSAVQSFEQTPAAFGQTAAERAFAEPQDQGFFGKIGDLLSAGESARLRARAEATKGIATEVAANRAADLAAAQKQAETSYGIMRAQKEHERALELETRRAEGRLPPIFVRGEIDKEIAVIKGSEKKEGEEVKRRAKAAAAAAGAPAREEKAAAEKAKPLTELRKEFNQLPPVKTYGEAQISFGKLERAATGSSPASTLSLIYSFMNTIDPGSVVKETEAEIVRSTGRLDDRIKGKVLGWLSGDTISPAQRADLLNEARNALAAHKDAYDTQAARYGSLAETAGGSIDDILGKKPTPPAPSVDIGGAYTPPPPVGAQGTHIPTAAEIDW